jgi:hypothetical protein
MGLWQNIAFVQTEDIGRVERVLHELVVARGRTITTPVRRTPTQYDPMQYGTGDEVARWGIAGFRGAPGWTVVRTAPFELLLTGEPLLLGELARGVGANAFSYNLYDGDSHFLCEASPAGRIERSGFVGSDPEKHWGEDGPDEDRIDPCFRIVAAPASVQHALAGDHLDAAAAELVAAFGGANRRYCDNLFTIEVLLPHAPLPVDGFVLYADRDVDR